MKAAVFDFDGTLGDSMEFWENLATNYLSSIGLEGDSDLSRTIEKLTVDEGLIYMKEKYNIKKSVKKIKEEIDLLLVNYYKKDVELKANAIELLELLKEKNIQMAIASLSNEELIMSVLKRYGIENYFEFIQTCENTGLRKDDKRFFHLLKERLALEGENILVFEDSLYAIRAAKDAGLKVVGVEDDSAIKNLQDILKISDLYIKNFKEFIELLDEKDARV